MRTIDLQTWPRRRHFELFNAFDYPHFNLCANVDLTRLHTLVQQRGLSLNISLIYLLARAANAVPEFRYRIHGREVVEYEVVHPSPTVLTEAEIFSFCTIPYTEDFAAFSTQAAAQIDAARRQPTLDDDGRDDLLFMTSIPWVSFTSIQHPIHMHPVDSVPRIAWGKFYHEGDAVKMPLSVQAHHALMDGLHVGRFYALAQSFFNQPEAALGFAAPLG